MNTAETLALSPGTQPDWFLQQLVRLAQVGDLDIGITLQVGGLLVSGFIVSGKKYFEGFAESFARPIAGQHEITQSFTDALSQHGAIYDKRVGDEVLLPSYIHLKNARFYNSTHTAIPANKGVWWRGRLSEVGGFTLGAIGLR